MSYTNLNNTGVLSSKNYIKNPSAEIDTTGWATYADAAGTSPVDGTGGSPSITLTRSTTSPLSNTASFLITKGATNRQGDGVSYDFDIASGDQGQVLNCSMRIQPGSGFTASSGAVTSDSDLEYYIYDKTNATLIPVSPKLITAGVGFNQVSSFTFQSASNSTSYRLIMHVATTSATAWTFKFDEVVVSRNQIIQGTPVTDWVSYTPTGNWVTNTTYTGKWRRVGDTVELQINVALSGAPSGNLNNVTLPSGMIIDTAKIVSTTLSNHAWGTAIDGGTQTYPVWGRYASTTGFDMFITGTAGSYADNSANLGATVPFTFGSGDSVSIFARFPIVGASSNVQMSSDADTRVIDLLATGTPASTTSGNPAIFPTVSKDSAGAYNASTGRYTVPVSGDYIMSVFADTNTANTAFNVYVNAVSSTKFIITASNNAGAGSVLVPGLKAGDIIDVRPNNTISWGASQLSIIRVSGPATIAATEKVYLEYTNNGGTSLTANTTNIDWSTKVVDSHNAWNGTTFTAPRSGWYQIEALAAFTTAAARGLLIYKNGSRYSLTNPADSTSYAMSARGTFLLAGDLITFRTDTGSTLSNSSDHWLTISSQG